MITIWHNPRCSKSRQTLALIEEKGEVTIRRYLDDAPSVSEIQEVLNLLGLSAVELMRVKEKRFKELELSKSDPEAGLIAAMAQNPVLIERPVVLANGKAAIGRPPEQVLDIL
ncbi:Arsenate reductase [Thalassovita autumnalis]|uniref:Arsenate reductase n=1 Tax=Thalassovita autumnalis TaxID=2072972 RepID=A0A0P1FHE8_9RHOB|nr:arsenate reductase (glutaredoxin) [Thalassovita autumnalis]CUH67301.1 Arsenate reductase [Thalassovita autumnalis]CUH73830.1 Arsenate reductase [Thalassovita autumnalis]